MAKFCGCDQGGRKQGGAERSSAWLGAIQGQAQAQAQAAGPGSRARQQGAAKTLGCTPRTRRTRPGSSSCAPSARSRQWTCSRSAGPSRRAPVHRGRRRHRCLRAGRQPARHASRCLSARRAAAGPLPQPPPPCSWRRPRATCTRCPVHSPTISVASSAWITSPVNSPTIESRRRRSPLGRSAPAAGPCVSFSSAPRPGAASSLGSEIMDSLLLTGEGAFSAAATPQQPPPQARCLVQRGQRAQERQRRGEAAPAVGERPRRTAVVRPYRPAWTLPPQPLRRCRPWPAPADALLLKPSISAR
eukprot:COSAG01_NODE_13475_length_1581_cov_1.517544_1_plen_302_part_00